METSFAGMIPVLGTNKTNMAADREVGGKGNEERQFRFSLIRAKVEPAAVGRQILKQPKTTEGLQWQDQL